MQSDFPVILARLRKERGISQKQAAIELGVSQALLSHYEKGIRECGLDFLSRAADYFGVTTDYLLGKSTVGCSAAVPESESEFDAERRVITNAQALTFELLHRCEKDNICETGMELIKLQVYQTILYIFGICPGEQPFTLPSRYSKPAVEGEIIRQYAKLGLIKEKNDNLSYPLISADKLSAAYPDLYSDLCSLIKSCEENLN